MFYMRLLAFISILAWSGGALADPHLYLCRSPLLAKDFYDTLVEINRQGVSVTATIADEVCAHMQAVGPQCLRIEGADFKPIASGWNGALAMANGSAKIWFHNPDDFGWIDSRLFIEYLKTTNKP